MISEIMYHPDSDRESEEYVELANPGSPEAQIGGWRFTQGITYTFPASIEIPAHGFLVLARDASGFDAAYPGTPRLASFEGRLSNSGERLTLEDAEGNIQDTVNYADQEPWSPRADGGGGSLECLVLTEPNDTPVNWRASRFGVLGTPASPNSVARAEVPPLMWGLQITPPDPAPFQPTRVSVRATEDVVDIDIHIPGRGIFALHDDGTSGDLVAGDNVWSVLGEAPSPGERVNFHMVAFTAQDVTSEYPEYAPLERFGVYCPGPGDGGDVPVWRLWLSASVVDQIRADPYNDDTYPAALGVGGVYVEPVFVRARGDKTRAYPKFSWKIFLPEWYEINGQQTFNLNGEYTDRTGLREILSYRLWARAGYPASTVQPVRLLVAGQYLGYFVSVENMNRRWLRARGMDDNQDMFGARRGLFAWGPPVSIEARFDREIDATGREGWDALIRAVETINAPGLGNTAWQTSIEAIFNPGRLYDYLAIRACLQSFDDKNKNVFLYREPPALGRRWLLLPYDQDVSQGRIFFFQPQGLLDDTVYTDFPAIWPGPAGIEVNPLFNRISNVPAMRAQVYRRIGHLLATTFRMAEVGPLIDEVHAQIVPSLILDTTDRGSDAHVMNGAEELREFYRLRRQALLDEISGEFAVVTAERLADHLVGLDPLYGPEIAAGDADGDGLIDVQDLVTLANDPPAQP